MRISDWSSDVCSSDLQNVVVGGGGRVQVSVLGPLRVIGADGCDLTPDGVLQRRLLALLVANRGRVVRADAAIEALWSASLPRDRSEERRVGKECVRTCRSRWSPLH